MMDKWMMVSGVVLGLPVFTSTISFLLWPGVLLKAMDWFHRRRLGLAVRYAHSGSYRFCYSSRGTTGDVTPSLLLLHGFQCKKDAWCPLIEHIPRSQHVVCVDLPGHGETSRTGVEDYNVEGMVKRIHQFVQSIALDKRRFHLVGFSMGGSVAGVYAARYPSHLSAVTLICPSGLNYPKKLSDLTHYWEMEKTQQDYSNPLFPRTIEELQTQHKIVFYKPPNVPLQFQRGMLANEKPHYSHYRQVFLEMLGEKSRHLLQENMHLITTPVQVIWGKEDKLLDVSGAAVLKAALPDCQVALLDNCGHVVAVEQPRILSKLIMDFLSAQQANNENTKKSS